MKGVVYLGGCLLLMGIAACSKKDDGSSSGTPLPANVSIRGLTVNGQTATNHFFRNVPVSPEISIRFSAPLNRSTVPAALTLRPSSGSPVPCTTGFTANDSVLLVRPSQPLNFLSRYTFSVSTAIRSVAGASLDASQTVQFHTQIDSSRKFPVLSDPALLDLVQRQTFRYFWDFAHPVSGLARERNTSGDLVTSGGSGFGIMCIPVAIQRGFITRAEGLARLQTIVAFLKNTAVKVKGAFPHWLNGATGAIIPFSANDNGADLVETSYLMMGLLTARQYFNGAGTAETDLRNDINSLYQAVEWDWFRQGGQQVLYWHYSNDRGWVMNLPIRGWNECLITYVLAASSPTHSIPASVYTNGWKSGPGFLNGNAYFGYTLPLGPPGGGPLFFAHYSFLGINPNGLNEGTLSYAEQTRNHSLINQAYCRNNPLGYFGYSDSVWGLTASDVEGGYTASSPSNDVSVIAPTAALSSFPFTPAESMKALRFFYEVLGDKIWKEYGFTDAFSLHQLWFAASFLAIDQGPILIMIENYRSGLLWNLFTSCPEVKAGMTALGFTAPYL